ncbi:MAG: hypothetical protein IPM11_14110 [Micropruina sp.]|nr:hypothetical protein [Micropruina sp.]
MDDRTYPYSDVEPLDSQLNLLDRDWRVVEDHHARGQQAEAARVAELKQAHAVDGVGNQVEADVPLPFASPPGAAPAL